MKCVIVSLLTGLLVAAVASASPPEGLHVRIVGAGPTAIVLHGGPDFDQSYLVPEFDDVGASMRLVYYDQRGRGRSATGVRAADVSLQSDTLDLDSVRRHAGAERVILVGHSWGTLLALEYALRYPENVSALVLMNPAPVSVADVGALRTHYLAKLGASMDEQRRISKGAAYMSGDPEAVTARYRIHFRPAFREAAAYEKLMLKMDTAFRAQGAEGILLARAVEDRLYADTWEKPDYDLHPKLRVLTIPTLILSGEEDFIPMSVAEHAAAAIPGARLVKLPRCGHFSYLECPAATRQALDEFLHAMSR